MMWSSVPKVRSGMRTVSFESFIIWKACGVVTSWMRCRPIRSWVWPDGSVRTVCASHTLSSSVRAMGGLLNEGLVRPLGPTAVLRGVSCLIESVKSSRAPCGISQPGPEFFERTLEAKSPQNRRRNVHVRNLVVELFGQDSACRLDLCARRLKPAKKRREGAQAPRLADEDRSHGILRAAHADHILRCRGVGSVMIQPSNAKGDPHHPASLWRGLRRRHGVGLLPPDRIAVPVRPHSRWTRDLVLDFGG